MTRTMQALGLWGMLLVLGLPLMAQLAGPPPPPPPPPPMGIVGGMASRDILVERAGANMHFIAAEPAFLGKPVTGAPYSAEAVNETTRVLGDGTRIQNSNTTRIYRDSAGRTRIETQLTPPGNSEGAVRTQVTILDPLNHKTTILDAESRTARVLSLPPMPPMPPSPDGAGPREVRWVMESAEGGNARRNVTIQRKVVIAGSDGTVPAAPGAPAAPAAPPPPDAAQVVMLPRAGAATLQVHHLERPGDVQIERLGERMVEGVRAEGTRRTVTMPVGAIGNDRPIVSVTEEWRSPELQVVLLRTTRDPQIGEITYRLSQVSRAEPLESLFLVPDGYRVLEATKVVTEEIRGPE